MNPSGDSNPEQLTAHDGKLFFSASTAAGRELWWTDGVTTNQVKDINPSGDSNPTQLFSSSDGSLYFLADDGASGYGLYATDGTGLGTTRLADTTGSFGAYGYTDFLGEVFLVLDTAATGRELWKTDGTPTGTELVRDIDLGPAGSSPDLAGAAIGDKIVFNATTADDGREVWVTDGTTEGTEQVTMLNGRGADTALGVWGDDYIFNGDEGDGPTLWKSDGTAAGTLEISSELNGSAAFLPLEDVFLTAGFDESSELYGVLASDGDSLDVLVDGNVDGEFQSGVVSGDIAWIVLIKDSTQEVRLWQSDGTAAGTEAVFTSDSFIFRPLALENGAIAFISQHSNVNQVWHSDGVTTGPLTTRTWGSQINWPRDVTAVGDDLYFRGGDGTAGNELFKLEILPGLNVVEGRDFESVPEGADTRVDMLLGSDWLTVALCTEPTSNVVVDVALSVSDGTQIDKPVLTFTPANWDQPQIVTIVGAGIQSGMERTDNEVQLTVRDGGSAGEYDGIEVEIPVDVFAVPSTDLYSAFTLPDTPVEIAILGEESDEVQFVSVDDPANGSVVFSEPSLLTYTPDADFEGTDTFNYQARLTQQAAMPDLPNAPAKFGAAVAVSNDVAVVGAPRENTNGSNSGAAYVMKRIGSRWIEVAKLVGSGTTAGDEFGTSVAIQGRRIVVGSHRDAGAATLSGVAYVFEQNADGEWVEVAKLADPTGRKKDRFGSDVALEGDTIAVAAHLDDNLGTDSGSVFVFDRNAATGEWELVKRIKADDASRKSEFGSSISLSNHTLAVGAIKDDQGAVDAGAAYVFTRDEGGLDNWGQVNKLLAPQPARKDSFGFDISISEASSTLAVGTPLDSVGRQADAGAVFVFENDGSDWVFDTKLVETDAGDFQLARRDQFGSSVAVEGKTIIVGAPFDDEYARNAGAAYVFHQIGSTWKADKHLAKFGSQSAGKNTNFGSAVTLANTNGDFFTLVGTPRDTEGGANAGAIHADYGRVVDVPIEVTVSGDTLKSRFSPYVVSHEQLSRAELEPVVNAAIVAWQEAGIRSQQLVMLQDTPVHIFDLPGDTLGLATDRGIVLDTNAAGHGWSVTQSLPAADRMDLLTVVLHEFGHVLGRSHDEEHLMSESLGPGQRYRPDAVDLIDRVHEKLELFDE
ncbi:MAG: Ig-like domain-containing protein [Planctomycetaceae bacterium]